MAFSKKGLLLTLSGVGELTLSILTKLSSGNQSLVDEVQRLKELLDKKSEENGQPHEGGWPL